MNPTHAAAVAEIEALVAAYTPERRADAVDFSRLNAAVGKAVKCISPQEAMIVVRAALPINLRENFVFDSREHHTWSLLTHDQRDQMICTNLANANLGF